MIVCFLTLFLFVSLPTFDAAGRPFKRSEGGRDGMTWFNYNDHAAWPIQESPIYGIEYDSKNKFRRFLTIRKRNIAIVLFSNNWVVGFGINGRWRVKCPRNMLAMGMACHAGNCDNISLLCGKARPNFQIVSSKKKVVQPNGAGSSVFCPDGMYAEGVECVGKGCKNPGLSCVQLNYNKVAPGQDPFSVVGHRQYVSASFSSDGHGHSWLMGGPVYAVECSGKAGCENKRLFSAERGLDYMVSDNLSWRGPVSAAGSSVSCPKEMVIAQMSCSGSSCSSIHIGCAPFINKATYRVLDSDVRNSNTFSTFWPHQAVGTCPNGYFAKSINCLRISCSVLMLGCVQIVIRE